MGTDAVGSTVWLLDGTRICQGSGNVHHVTRRADGTYVMAVEAPWPVPTPNRADMTPVPYFAHDCSTNTRQSIEPIRFTGADGQQRLEVAVASRHFVATNAGGDSGMHLINERGVSIDGDDNAQFPAFDASAATVAYLVYRDNPHVPYEVAVRDTTTGSLVWTARFDHPISSVQWLGDRVLIGFADPASIPTGVLVPIAYATFDHGAPTERTVVASTQQVRYATS